VPIVARDFSHLRGRLVGMSDRALEQHLELYGGFCRRLADLEAAYPVVSWRPEGERAVPVDASAILAAPVASLELRPLGVLAECLQILDRELAERGIMFRPNFVLGEPAMWATDRAITINLPFYLANPTLWRLAERGDRPVYTADTLLRDLRHETGHVLGYAFELWRTPAWVGAFGDFRQPYRDEYKPDPRSTQHVNYTTDSLRGHYAQKHPDEDWAETFAAWLDPASNWAEQYRGWPGALAKLQYVEALWRAGRLGGQPPNAMLGRTISYRQLPGTVGQQLGVTAAVRPLESTAGDHAELLRREPALYNAIVLHELYFEQLDGAGTPRQPPEPLERAAVAAWGSWDSYLLDLRAIAGSTNGWALTCWDQRAGRLRNAMVEGHDVGVLAGAPIVLAIDTWEHVFAADFGAGSTGRAWALGAFFTNVNWGMVAGRLPAAASP
jgi:superoxide dismutase